MAQSIRKGLDIANFAFQIHCINAKTDKAGLAKNCSCRHLLCFCHPFLLLISTATYGAADDRLCAFTKFTHSLQWMTAQYIAPTGLANNHDANESKAIYDR